MKENAPDAPNIGAESPAAAEGVMSSSPMPLNEYQYALSTIELTNQSSSCAGSEAIIRDVWIQNFFQVMQQIEGLIDDYPYIAMDTEFPGTVYLPIDTENEFEYNVIKANCDNLKLIQFGISLTNGKGEYPDSKTVGWQFNLEFDESTEQSIEESMIMLKNQAGLTLDRHKTDGIPHRLMAEYLISSGLVMSKSNHWITFHGGADFGYLLKILSGEMLPDKEIDFFRKLKEYLCNFYDCKEIKREVVYLSGGLSKVAYDLDVDRVGAQHQAGSDAQLTLGVFFRLRHLLKKMWKSDENSSDSKIEEQLNHRIFGLGDSVNDENYAEQQKLAAKNIAWCDETGYVNLRVGTRMMDSTGLQATSVSTTPQPRLCSSAQNMHMQNMNNMGISTMQSGKFANMDLHAGHGQKHQTKSPWMPPNQNMMRAQMIGQGAPANHMATMVGHNQAATTDVIANNYGGMGNIMQPNNLDINGLNQNMGVHIGALNNIGGYNPSMINMNGMGQATANQAANQAQNMSGQISQNMVHLQQQYQPILTNQLNAGQIDNSGTDMMGQTSQANSQYGRLNVNNHYHQTQQQQNLLMSQQMQLDGSHNQHPNSNNTNFTFGSGINNGAANTHLNSLPKHGNTGQLGYGQFHQTYMDPQNASHPYGPAQNNSHLSSSPQMMGSMGQNSMMSHHHPGQMNQFQQMNQHTGQHNYYMPPNSQQY